PARRAEILNNLGAALLKLPDGHAEAVRSFRAALALRPDHADLRRNLHVALCTYGLVLSGLGRLTEAVEGFEEALRLDPRDDGARFLLAQACQSRVEPEKATVIYRDLLRRHPEIARHLRRTSLP